MSEKLTPFIGSSALEHALRGSVTVPRNRSIYPGINQEEQDTVPGLGSADHEGPHGDD